MTSNQTPTREELAKAMQKIREISLKNLKAQNLSNLAVAYFAQSKKGGYGERDNSAVEKHLYLPAISSGLKFHNPENGEEEDLMTSELMSSREDGERYSGNISEKGLMKKSASIIQDSLGGIRVKDMMELIGSKIPIDDSYKGRYLVELANSPNEEDKKVYETLVGGYMNYITSKGVSESLEKDSKQIRKNLEGLVGSA